MLTKKFFLFLLHPLQLEREFPAQLQRTHPTLPAHGWMARSLGMRNSNCREWADAVCAKPRNIINIIIRYLVMWPQSSGKAVTMAKADPFPCMPGSSPSLSSVPSTARYSLAPVLHTPITSRLVFREKETACLKPPSYVVKPGNTPAARQETKLQDKNILPFSQKQLDSMYFCTEKVWPFLCWGCSQGIDKSAVINFPFPHFL